MADDTTTRIAITALAQSQAPASLRPFEGIEQPSPRKALLFAHVITPYGGHTEKYTLTNDPKRSGDRWPVEEITLCDFSNN